MTCVKHNKLYIYFFSIIFDKVYYSMLMFISCFVNINLLLFSPTKTPKVNNYFATILFVRRSSETRNSLNCVTSVEYNEIFCLFNIYLGYNCLVYLFTSTADWYRNIYARSFWCIYYRQISVSIIKSKTRNFWNCYATEQLVFLRAVLNW